MAPPLLSDLSSLVNSNPASGLEERRGFREIQLSALKKKKRHHTTDSKLKIDNPGQKKKKKEINPEYSLEGLMLKLQYSGHLVQRADSLEKTLMLGKTEGRRRRG